MFVRSILAGSLTPDREVREVELMRPEVTTDERELRRQADIRADPATIVETKRLDGTVGYIRFTTFAYQRGVREFDAALRELADTDALILDMRGNGGGRSDVLAEVTGRFFDRGRITISRIIMRVPGRQTQSSDPEPIVTRRGRVTWTKPVVLLVDAGCFSACDMFASAMEEQGRALLIGATPTGGGTASALGQRVMPSWDGVAVRASLLVALRADGSHIEGHGIRPHIVVTPTVEDYMAGRDPELERALRAIAAGEAPALK
jgi:carboxyl-terminal processing protease